MIQTTTHAPLVSRRERAELSPAEVNRQAFGVFCSELERLACLTPTQMLVAKLLAVATLKDGFNSIEFSSLQNLMLVDGGSFAGLAANDLSPAINGSALTGRMGLKHFGIVKVDTRSDVESAMPVSILTVMAASADWTGVPADGWRWSNEQMLAWRMHVRSFCRRRTPALPGLATEPDLLDALAEQSAEVAADQVESDALNGRVVLPMAATRPGRSECRNAKDDYSRMNNRVVPNVRTPLKLKEERKTESPLRPLRAVSLSDLKARTQGCDELDVIAAMAEVFNRNQGGYEAWEGIGRKYVDGAKWRNRWRDGAKRQAVRAVFAQVATDMVERKTIKAIGGHAESLWFEFSKESLYVPS